MSLGGRLWRAAALAGAIACCVSMSGPVAVAADTAAHEVADKFANDGMQGQSPEERHKAEEARKKEAERQAQEAMREAARKRAEAALRADRERQKAAGKLPQPPAKTPVDPKAEEDDMLTRARLEEEARRASERARAEEEARRKLEAILNDPDTPTAEQIAAQNAALRAKEIAQVRRVWQAAQARIAEAARKEEETKSVAEAARKEAEAKAIADAKAASDAAEARARMIAHARRTFAGAYARLAVTATREAEARAAAEAKIAAETAAARTEEIARARRIWVTARRRAEETAKREDVARREAEAKVLAEKAASQPTTVASLPAPREPGRARESNTALPATDAHAMEGRVTILLVMSPGNKGIRRHNKTADPVLCLNDGCYVSEGPDVPAHFLPTRRVLGFGGTFGERAGACRNQLGCVFRGVLVGEVPLIVQPIDMHVIKHDRRRIQAIETDSRCRPEGSRLVCAHGIYAEDYAMWIVPESLAREVGPEALQRAVAEGLNGPRSATLDRGRY